MTSNYLYTHVKVFATLMANVVIYHFFDQAATLDHAIASKQAVNSCPPAILEQLTTHVVQPGDTVESIAQQYDLLPSSIMAFNSALQPQAIEEGDRLQIPPYNGSIQSVEAGTTWQTLAETYRMRADVLFEQNGCSEIPPSQIFVAGAAAQISNQDRQYNWPTNQPIPPTFSTLPLGRNIDIITDYGWQYVFDSDEFTFHSGLDLFATSGTAVQAVGSGVVAFVGEKGDYGLLIVINHDQGLQTRYAQLSSAQVKPGDKVIADQIIGQSGQSGAAPAPHLHFEVRLNSNSGWLAQDPAIYLAPLTQ